MFDQYEALAKEQYTDFKFDSWEIQSVMKTIQGFEEGSYDDYFGKMDYLPFAYKIPNRYIGCVFTNVMTSDNMFFMIDIRGIK